MDPGLEIDVAIRSHGIPWEWPEAVVDEAGRLEAEPLEEDKQHRVDLRKLPFVTIDGEDARDFDDAVYCEKRTLGGWRLWVAIADVSHYVRPGSALDEEAAHRGNSVYFPERVVPMLPEALSNGLCSLKPAVDRLAMVCEMELSADGQAVQVPFLRGGHPLPCPPHLHPGGRGAGEGLPPGGGQAPGARSQAPAQSLQGIARGPGQARCDRFRNRGNPHHLRRAAQDRSHRAGGAQRRPQADRGVHAVRQRRRGGFLRGQRAAHAVPGARGSHRGETGEPAQVSRRTGPGPAAAAPSPRPCITSTCCCRSQIARMPTSSRPCCCARCARRSTSRRTTAISACTTRPMPTSPRPSGATRTCWCTGASAA